ncbi:hypothetical protein LZ32DRAFT_290998 [Colletotrichum eremochloae]|nr:hypothetical protein LZ32DRAFT_290998 [Colletotrichum eremochloae]
MVDRSHYASSINRNISSFFVVVSCRGHLGKPGGTARTIKNITRSGWFRPTRVVIVSSEPSSLLCRLAAHPERNGGRLNRRNEATGRTVGSKTGFGSITSRLHAAAAGGNLVLSLADWLESTRR